MSKFAEGGQREERSRTTDKDKDHCAVGGALADSRGKGDSLDTGHSTVLLAAFGPWLYRPTNNFDHLPHPDDLAERTALDFGGQYLPEFETANISWRVV